MFPNQQNKLGQLAIAFLEELRQWHIQLETKISDISNNFKESKMFVSTLFSFFMLGFNREDFSDAVLWTAYLLLLLLLLFFENFVIFHEKSGHLLHY